MFYHSVHGCRKSHSIWLMVYSTILDKKRLWNSREKVLQIIVKGFRIKVKPDWNSDCTLCLLWPCQITYLPWVLLSSSLTWTILTPWVRGIVYRDKSGETQFLHKANNQQILGQIKCKDFTRSFEPCVLNLASPLPVPEFEKLLQCLSLIFSYRKPKSRTTLVQLVLLTNTSIFF